MKRNKAYKYRVYPNQEQRMQLAKTFGCARFVYNHFLAKQGDHYESGGRYLSKTSCNNDCNQRLKQEYPWLREVDKFSLTNAIYNLDSGFQRFFSKQGGSPKFKSKRAKQSYSTNFTNRNIELLEKQVKLPKLGKVKAKIHRRPPEDWVLKSATVSKTASGKYFVSLLYEYEAEITAVEPKTAIGLDFSVPHLFVTSEGGQADERFIQNYRKSKEKLAKEQRVLSHRQKGSSRWNKQRIKVAKLHEHITNQRKDYLHKVSTEIANQYDAVCIEDIKMRDITENLNGLRKGMGKYVLDNGFHFFTTLLAYKLEDRGKHLSKVEEDYPSTQTCSECGHIFDALHLSDRRWVCPQCGTTHDRDKNAAVNIRNHGMELLLA